MGMTADVGIAATAAAHCRRRRRARAVPDRPTHRRRQAAQLKLVNQVFDSQDALLAHARQVAASIAGKSPLAVRGTKTGAELQPRPQRGRQPEYVANWNAAMLLSNDIQQAVMASMSKRTAQFADRSTIVESSPTAITHRH